MTNGVSKRPIKWALLRKRFIRHHLPIGIGSLAAIAAAFQLLESKDWIWKISFSTAYISLALLAATLCTGPWKVVKQRPNPVSDDLTRDIGIWAGLIGLLHVAFGLQVHMRGKMWLLFFNEEFAFPYLRFDLFGSANYTGLVAAVILLILLIISNNRSLQKLGAKGWKRIQRWNYLLFLLTIVHSIIYMVLENRLVPYILLFAVVVSATVVLQAMGFTRYKKQRRQESPH